MKPSLVHFFNKLVVCPASSSSPGFNHWGLSGFGWGLGALLWKPSSLSTVYFGSLVFWHSLKVNAEGEPLNKRTAWEMCCWFGYFGRAFSRRERERLVLPTFGLARWTMMDLTYFCVIPMLIFLLYIVHRTWQSCYGGLPRDILMGSWWKWKLTLLWPPPQCSLFFLPLFFLLLFILTLSQSQALPQQEEPNYRDIGPMLKTW